MQFLKAKQNAVNNKPRGFEEIRAVLKQRIRHGSFLVFDKWMATVKAAQNLGFKTAPPVNHSLGWRDKATGFHSNDVEGEFSCIKRWCRARYSRLLLTELDMHEYAFYMNAGKSISVVAGALVLLNDGKHKLVIIR